MRDIYTTVTYEDRRFRIRKFTPWVGMYITKVLLAKIAPLGEMLDGSALQELGSNLINGLDVKASGLFELIAKALDSVTEDELRQIITKSLAACAEILPGGDAPVIDSAGNYGAIDVEYNLPLTLCLTIEAVKWSAQDFFTGALWDSVRRATSDFFPQSTPTSTEPSLPQ